MRHNLGLLRLRDNVDFQYYPHIFPICVADDSFHTPNPWGQCNVLGWPDFIVSHKHLSFSQSVGYETQTVVANICTIDFVE